MSAKIKKLPLLISLFALLILISGSPVKVTAAPTLPDYAGEWDFYFYDDSGTLQGKKKITISKDGTFSDKAILNLDNVIYNTEVDGKISPNGVISEGNLTDTDLLEMTGVIAGSFNQEEGNGTWKNYYKNNGTWKAIRSENKR